MMATALSENVKLLDLSDNIWLELVEAFERIGATDEARKVSSQNGQHTPESRFMNTEGWKVEDGTSPHKTDLDEELTASIYLRDEGPVLGDQNFHLICVSTYAYNSNMTQELYDYGKLLIAACQRKLSEMLYVGADAIYLEHCVDLPSQRFPRKFLLRDLGRLGISEIAISLGQSSSAVSQMSRKLLVHEVVKEESDQLDRHHRFFEPIGTRCSIHEVACSGQDCHYVSTSGVSSSGRRRRLLNPIFTDCQQSGIG
jgi:hypothetical protein